MTLHKYIFRQRLIKAYELVNTTDKSLEEIAEMCGFSSQSHLSTAFKKEYGISPGKLRLS
jgi:AraC family transcriptional regulator